MATNPSCEIVSNFTARITHTFNLTVMSTKKAIHI